ncbi:MAG TPA: sulfotransferase [Caulobacteraceae bacterium]
MIQVDQHVRRARDAVRAKNWHAAHAACMEALRAQPESAEPYYLLGLVALENGRLRPAAELLSRARGLQPADARYSAALGKALLGMGRLEQAREAVDGAWSSGATDAVTLDTVGVIYSQLNVHERAAEAFRRAAALEPKDAQLQHNLGWSEQFLGDFDAAERAYRRALQLDPSNHKAWLALVELRKQTAGSNSVRELQALFGRSRDAGARLHLGHALAKSYEDLGEPAAAFDWLARGKAAVREQIGYSRSATEAMFEAAASTAGAVAADACRSPDPIFIVGMPRTGTTLVERIVSSHPEVASAGELRNLPLLARRMSGGPATRRFLDADTMRRAAEGDLGRLGRDYVESARPAGAARFIDKLPLNFLFAGLIGRAMPEARIVCLRRDPMDTVLSNYRNMFGPDFDPYHYSFDLAETARYYVMFDRLVAHWRAVLPPGRFTEVRYEDVVADQEGQSRRVLEFLGLPWTDQVLDFHENAAPVSTASAVQVRSPVYATSVGRWKQYGDRLAPALAVLEEAGLLQPG